MLTEYAHKAGVQTRRQTVSKQYIDCRSSRLYLKEYLAKRWTQLKEPPMKWRWEMPDHPKESDGSGEFYVR